MTVEAIPTGTVEDVVIGVFREVLGEDERVDATSDFFQLGGNSILGARLVARLRQSFEVKVGVRDLFRGRTVGAMAEVIRQRGAGRPA
jgi:acyl carrier protein